MKLNLKRLIFLIAITLFNMNMVFADSPPMPPPPGIPPVPPPVPIDSPILFMIIVGALLGFYLISKRKQTTKA